MTTAPLTHRRMALFAAGTGAAYIFNTTVVTWIMYFYVPPDGSGRVPLVSLGLFTLAMTLGRVVDALADLPVAYLSDRSYGRWGRRIPFIIFGGVPLFLVFVALWAPPGAPGSQLTAVWFAVTINLFFVVFTAVFNPQYALLPEIARTDRERVAVSTYNATFTMLAAALVMMGSGFLVEHLGYRGMALVFGSLALVLTYFPVLGIRERPRSRDEVPPYSFRETLSLVFRNRPFLHYEFNMAVFYIGFNLLLAGVPYFVRVVLRQPESAVGLYLGAHLAAAMLVFPLVGPLARRFGKKRLYLAAILAIALIIPLVCLVGRLPLPLTAGAQFLTVLALAGLPLGVLYVLPGALISDCIDYDAGRTGTRREAIYVGVQGILQNAAVAVSTVFMGLVFNTFGFSSAAPTGVYLLGPLAGLFFLIAFFIFRPYPLDEKRHPELAAVNWRASPATPVAPAAQPAPAREPGTPATGYPT